MPFGRQLQSFAQSKQPQMCPMMSNPMGMPPGSNPMGGPGSNPMGGPPGGNPMGGPTKEASLMLVPSPQQIQQLQYLNSFDGQELTIQKQPNTSVRDTADISPR